MESRSDTWPLTDHAVPGAGQRARSVSNRLRALGLIARKDDHSQLRMSRRLGLRTSTISNIVRELKAIGCVRDGGALEAERVGPKERDLEIVPEFAWSLGISLLPTWPHRVQIVDAQGRRIDGCVLENCTSMEDVANKVRELIELFAKKHKLERSRFLGVGVAIPAVVNSAEGVVLFSDGFELHNYPMRSIFSKIIGCPVWVERNVTCGAYAEHYVGVTRAYGSFVYLIINYDTYGNGSLGMSLVLDEKLFLGCNWAAGEVRMRFANRPWTMVARTGDSEEDFRKEYQHYIDVIVRAINIVDISCMVISTEDPRLTEQRLVDIHAQVMDMLIPVPGRNFEMLRSEINHDGLARGAALLALHRSLALQMWQAAKD